MATEGVTVPTPDPTLLTTDQLRREIDQLRQIIEARLDGSDKAVKLLQETTDRFPAAIGQGVSTLQELHQEKFDSVQIQFRERDVRVEQSSTATKIAVDAALQAAKEAVGAQNVSSAQAIAKSEAATTKQIDAIGTLISTQAKGTDDKIDDIKGRIQSLESLKAGAQEQRTQSKDFFGYIVGGAGMAVGLIGTVLAVVSFMAKP